MNEELARQKYAQLQQYDEQIQEYQKYIQEIDQQIQTLTQVIQWTKEIQDIKGETESFIPLANGIFVKGKVTDTTTFYVNVGEKTIVPKSPQDTKTMLEGQIDMLTNIRDQTIAEFQKTLEQAQAIEDEVRKEMEKTT